MKQKLIFLFFTLCCLRYSQAQTTYTEETSVVIMLDSLLADYHYKVKQNSSYDTLSMNKYNFSPTDVPRPSGNEIANRMKSIVSVIPLTYNEHVQRFIDLYCVQKRDLTSKILGLQYVYFPMIEEVFDREGLPLELKYLAVIESAFNPHAVSPAGATGLWQFIYITSKDYNLKVDSYVDERRDPYKATLAAARYLKNMYNIYQDWLLVIAAYNCGPGNVNRAIRMAKGNTNFWEIMRYLPVETRGYVPAFIAAAYFMNHPAEHNLYPIRVDFTYRTDTLQFVNQSTTLEHIANVSGVSLEELVDLNPELRIKTIPATSTPYVLRVPKKLMEYAMDHRESLLNPPYVPKPTPTFLKAYQKANPTYYTNFVKKTYGPKQYTVPENTKLVYHRVKPGETLGKIADQYNVDIANLITWNNITAYHIYAGQNLKIHSQVSEDSPKETMASAQPKVSVPPAPEKVPDAVKTPPPVASAKSSSPKTTQAKTTTKTSGLSASVGAKFHKVVAGESLWEIAKKYSGLTVEKLKSLNGLTNQSKLQVGQKLIISK